MAPELIAVMASSLSSTGASTTTGTLGSSSDKSLSASAHSAGRAPREAEKDQRDRVAELIFEFRQGRERHDRQGKRRLHAATQALPHEGPAFDDRNMTVGYRLRARAGAMRLGAEQLGLVPQGLRLVRCDQTLVFHQNPPHHERTFINRTRRAPHEGARRCCGRSLEPALNEQGACRAIHGLRRGSEGAFARILRCAMHNA